MSEEQRPIQGLPTKDDFGVAIAVLKLRGMAAVERAALLRAAPTAGARPAPFRAPATPSLKEQLMSEQSFSEQDVVGAIRLAMEAGADPGIRAKVVDEILKRAPLTDPANVSSVDLLIPCGASS